MLGGDCFTFIAWRAKAGLVSDAAVITESDVKGSAGNGRAGGESDGRQQQPGNGDETDFSHGAARMPATRKLLSPLRLFLRVSG
jgi:hypothetical protein